MGCASWRANSSRRWWTVTDSSPAVFKTVCGINAQNRLPVVATAVKKWPDDRGDRLIRVQGARLCGHARILNSRLLYR